MIREFVSAQDRRKNHNEIWENQPAAGGAGTDTGGCTGLGAGGGARGVTGGVALGKAIGVGTIFGGRAGTLGDGGRRRAPVGKGGAFVAAGFPTTVALGYLGARAGGSFGDLSPEGFGGSAGKAVIALAKANATTIKERIMSVV